MAKLKVAFLASALALPALGPATAQPDVVPVPTSPEEGQLIPGFAQEFIVDRSERMTVPVSINGSEPFPFIVDTGAERTVIANQLAKRLKLEQGPQLKLATITGPTFADSYMIENLSMNTINVEMIEAPGLEQHNLGAYGLLGIDSLENHKVMLDFRQEKMDVLPSRKTAGLGKVERGMIVVTAKRRAGRMILSNARIGNLKVEIILDTGAQSSMGNFALREKLRSRDRRFDFIQVRLKGVTGDIILGHLTQIKSIDVGGVAIADLPVTFADNYAFKALKLENKPAILLGMDALKLFDRVMVDFVNRRVGFDLPNGANRQRSMQLAMD
jgi:predicted aspartyl protease